MLSSSKISINSWILDKWNLKFTLSTVHNPVQKCWWISHPTQVQVKMIINSFWKGIKIGLNLTKYRGDICMTNTSFISLQWFSSVVFYRLLVFKEILISPKSPQFTILLWNRKSKLNRSNFPATKIFLSFIYESASVFVSLLLGSLLNWPISLLNLDWFILIFLHY